MSLDSESGFCCASLKQDTLVRKAMAGGNREEDAAF